MGRRRQRRAPARPAGESARRGEGRRRNRRRHRRRRGRRRQGQPGAHVRQRGGGVVGKPGGGVVRHVAELLERRPARRGRHAGRPWQDARPRRRGIARLYRRAARRRAARRYRARLRRRHRPRRSGRPAAALRRRDQEPDGRFLDVARRELPTASLPSTRHPSRASRPRRARGTRRCGRSGSLST